LCILLIIDNITGLLHPEKKIFSNTRLTFIAVSTVPTGPRISGVVNIWFPCLLKSGSMKTYGELEIRLLAFKAIEASGKA
jgi:hypothetical protein